MMAVAYEKWQGAGSAAVPSRVVRALHDARLDSFLADSQDDGVLVIDADGLIVDGNLALSRRTGYARAEILGRSMEEIIEPGQRRRIRAAIADALAGDGVRARADGVKRSGETCELAITFIPLFDEQRQVVGALAVTQNLSEAGDAARERQRDSALLELAGRVAGFVGWSLDVVSGALDWSGDLPELRGRMPGSLEALSALLSPTDAARFARTLQRSGRENRTLDITLALRFPELERHIRLVGRVIGSESLEALDAPVISGAAHDVTAAVLEQRQREAVEELLSRTVNALTDGFAVLDAGWCVEFVNERMAEMAGLDRATMVGASIWDLLPSLAGSSFEHALREALEQTTTVRVRDWWPEREVWLEVIVYPSGGGLAVHLRDITETETARQAYQEAQGQLARLGGLLDISLDAIIVRDLEHRIRYANAGAIALYGWQDMAVVGAPAADLLEVDLEQRAEATAAAVASGHWSGRITARTVDGRDLVLASRWQLLRDESGEPESILSVSVDITEEVAREEAVRRAERLESLGTFAGGIAHDLNNVLTPITLAAQILGQALAGTPEAETAAMIETAARRGARMVRQVLTFARGVESGTDPVDVVELLQELERMVAESLRPGVSLAIVPPPAGTTVTGDATQLLQVLSNLVSNANDAIEAQGTITVDARLEGAPDTDRATLVIEVRDDGEGMSPEVLARVWEPFFTTKPLGKGTGLGLPMVAAIIRAHHGTIEVDSDGRSGSTFTMTLPARIAPAVDADGPTEAPFVSGAGRTVLVVDDEEPIRILVRRILEGRGFRVLAASGGTEAASIITDGGNRIDAVLSDVTMPEGDGFALVRSLVAARESVPVLLMSGREDAGSLPDDVRDGCAGFLVKPLTATPLLAAVMTAIDSTTRGGRS